MAKKAVKKSVKKSKKIIEEDLEITKGLDIPSLFEAAIAKVAKQNEKDVSEFDGNLKAALVGVPLGYFALELMFSENVLGLGRVICLDGMQASGKSSLMWELCRILDQAGGASCVIDTEHKATENLGQGILGYENFPKVQFLAPETFEEAQQMITGMTAVLRTNAKKHGKRIPMLIGLDSTQGAVIESEAEKITKDGTASRSYAGAALLGAKFLPYITSRLSSMPITLVGVRHERQVDMGNGIKVPEPKGANEWSFNAFATFHLQKDGADINKVGQGGRNILIYLKKGTGEGLRIPVQMIWWDETINETESRRHFKFDWETAAFNIFTNPEKYKVPARIIPNFKDVLRLSNVSGGKAVCKVLGLDSPAKPDEINKALYHPDNRHTLEMLRAAFCVRIGQEFRYGDDFDELKAKQRAIILSRKASDVPAEERSADLEEDDDELSDDDAE
jgi:hypothetical protein